MSNLLKVSEEEIRIIVGKHYGVRKDGITLHRDYEFVRRGGDKVRQDFIYAIVDENFKERSDE